LSVGEAHATMECLVALRATALPHLNVACGA
jgi:hypothetical protein